MFSVEVKETGYKRKDPQRKDQVSANFSPVRLTNFQVLSMHNESKYIFQYFTLKYELRANNCYIVEKNKNSNKKDKTNIKMKEATNFFKLIIQKSKNIHYIHHKRSPK